MKFFIYNDVNMARVQVMYKKTGVVIWQREYDITDQ